MKLEAKNYLPFVILFLSFTSEIVHGIVTHELGTSDYAPLSVGEVVRGPIFILVVGYALLTVRHQSSRIVLAALLGMLLWIFAQGLVFQLTIGEIVGTLLRGVRWLYLFFLLNFFSLYIRRHRLSTEAVISQIKWLILLFYCVPILLSAAGIAGYTVYGDDSGRKGYAGFAMNSNVVASILVFMLPFYLQIERLRDWFMLFLYLIAGVLLGSKLTWISFAIILGIWLIWQMLGVRRRTWLTNHPLRVKRATLLAIVVLIVVIVTIPFTSLIRMVTDIYQGYVGLYSFYVEGNGFGINSSLLDVLTSHRTFRIGQLLEWSQQPNNTLMLLIGGGLPNYDLLYGEVDWVDLTALFGIFGVALFYSVVILFFFSVYKRYYPFRTAVLCMLLLTIAISLSSGHTYDGPLVGTVIAGVLGAFYAHPVVNRSRARLAHQVSVAASNGNPHAERANL